MLLPFTIKIVTMPKHHKGDTLISDLELKCVTSAILVTCVNGARHWLSVAHGQEPKRVTYNKLAVTLFN
jgi:hypothetical protein